MQLNTKNCHWNATLSRLVTINSKIQEDIKITTITDKGKEIIIQSSTLTWNHDSQVTDKRKNKKNRENYNTKYSFVSFLVRNELVSVYFSLSSKSLVAISTDLCVFRVTFFIMILQVSTFRKGPCAVIASEWSGINWYALLFLLCFIFLASCLLRFFVSCSALVFFKLLCFCLFLYFGKTVRKCFRVRIYRDR